MKYQNLLTQYSTQTNRMGSILHRPVSKYDMEIPILKSEYLNKYGTKNNYLVKTHAWRLKENQKFINKNLVNNIRYRQNNYEFNNLISKRQNGRQSYR